MFDRRSWLSGGWLSLLLWSGAPALHAVPALHAAPALYTAPPLHSGPAVLTAPTLHTAPTLYAAAPPRSGPALHSSPALYATPALNAALTADALLELADRPRDPLSTGVTHVRVTVSKRGKLEAEAEFDLYHKGEEKTLLVFTGGSQRGRRILTVGDQVWLLVPGVARPVPVSANQRLIGGVSMGDVARLRFARTFTAQLGEAPEKVDDLLCDVLALQAKQPGSSYASGTLWLDQQAHLPRRAVLNLPSGKPVREIRFVSYGQEAGSPIVASMRILDLVSKAGGETTLEFTGHRRIDLPDTLFTPDTALKLDARELP